MNGGSKKRLASPTAIAIIPINSIVIRGLALVQ
jgi:hypothetical protein